MGQRGVAGARAFGERAAVERQTVGAHADAVGVVQSDIGGHSVTEHQCGGAAARSVCSLHGGAADIERQGGCAASGVYVGVIGHRDRDGHRVVHA